jgi:hypothetical protein
MRSSKSSSRPKRLWISLALASLLFAVWLDRERITEIMKASAEKSFRVRAEYLEARAGFCRAWLDETLQETITATLQSVPLRLTATSRYAEAIPALREELKTGLRAILAEMADAIDLRASPYLGDPQSAEGELVSLDSRDDRAEKVVDTTRAETEVAPESTVAPSERASTEAPGKRLDAAQAAQQVRAQTVAKLIRELDHLKPQMFEDETEYNKLRARNPNFLAFKIAEGRPDLKVKMLAIRGSTRHIRLAQELAAAHHGREVSTIQKDWKNFKPAEFRRPT